MPHIDHLPRAILFRSQCIRPGHRVHIHTHAWHKLTYTVSGTLIVFDDNSRFLLPPEQAMWMPAGIPHATGALQQAEFRSLYIADRPDLRMPNSITTITVTPLLRSLILELSEIERNGDKDAYIRRVEALVLEQLPRQTVRNLSLPWPKGPILKKICDQLYADPSDMRDLEEWGREFGASARTLTRRFEHELGIGFREWRNRLCLFRAIDLLQTTTNSITEIAFMLGYSTPSAFSYMFRQQMGSSPSSWRRAQERQPA
ncbi:AraC family transcriptional regulator [Rhodovastum atsumiense]|nr:helix-turn-helix transcriptional regulator [Rhodovastum atsumiense]